MPTKTESQKRAQKKYMEQFAVARVRMEHGKYGTVQATAANAGQSVNAYINQAIREKMERDSALPTETPSDAAQDTQRAVGTALPAEPETPVTDP